MIGTDMRFYSLKQHGQGILLRDVRQPNIIRSQKQGSRMMFTTPPPVLRKATEDGSKAEISEEEIYQYTRSGESEKLAVRYRRFNLDALLDVAVNSAGNGARSYTKKITHIIDWQSTAVSEILSQNKVPPMRPPPGGYDQMHEPPSEISETVDYSSQEDDIFNHYQRLTRTKKPLRWAAINLPHSSILTGPVSLISGAWSRNDVFSFRHALISIAAHWKDIAPNLKTCPIDFTEHELELHNEEMELLEELGTVLHLLQNQNLISVGGMVLREDYDRAQVVNKCVKEMLLDMGEYEQQKALYEKIWPY
ncbi:hypothetical protein B7463_g1745, partial [Scytalidium lignicola]